MSQSCITLSNGVQMPLLGLGTWQAASREEAITAIKTAFVAGYRLIDTAAWYLNEELIGDALTEAIEEGLVKREDVFITTKIQPGELSPECHEPALKDSLRKLRVDYVDLYLAHMPTAFNVDMTEQLREVTVEDIWRGLERLYDLKLTKSIGVSNFNVEQIKRVIKIARVPIHNNQVELHLYFQQRKLRTLCKKHNISLTAYSPLGSASRTQCTLKGFVHDFTEAPPVLENELLLSAAKRHSKTPAQVVLRFLVQLGVSVIPKSANPKRIRENADIWDFELTPQEMTQLGSVRQQPRLFAQSFAIGHPEDPFADERRTA